MSVRVGRIDAVCSSCFADLDLKARIRAHGGRRGCDACNGYDSPTAPIGKICETIQNGIEKFWGLAVEQLPYETAEGGYQGPTWDTSDVLDELGLALPRDNHGDLLEAIIWNLPDEIWTNYDWLQLDLNEALSLSWAEFCDIVKYRRRFFFHNVARSPDDRDAYSPALLLQSICHMSQDLGIVRKLQPGTLLYRARSDLRARQTVSPRDFGPPPKGVATLSNRMSPPGIPMLYTALNGRTAIREVRANAAWVGLWETTAVAWVLDLAALPALPGTFSTASRDDTLALRFLYEFRTAIMAPVARNNRIYVDYVPSQIVAEFVRDFDFHAGKLKGIVFPSVVDNRGTNVALFMEDDDLSYVSGATAPGSSWLQFISSKRRRVP